MGHVTFCKSQTALPSPLALPSPRYSLEQPTLHCPDRPLMAVMPIAGVFPPQHRDHRATSATPHFRAPAATVRILALGPRLLRLGHHHRPLR